MNRIAIAAFTFWLLYNSLFAAAVLGWTKAPMDAYAWGIVPVIAMSFVMVGVTVGSQNKDR
jgi:hypothetical protein